MNTNANYPGLKKIINNNRYVFLIFLVLSVICYGIVINGPFLFDDEHFILKNSLVHSLRSIPDLYITSVTEGAHIEGNFYRPNQQLVYTLVYSVFKSDYSVPYHIISILFHLTNTCLLFLLLIQFSFSRAASFIASSIFLIHPVQTEAVSYISGLAGPMGLCFVLSGMGQFVKGMLQEEQRIMRLVLSTVFFVMALFTKENMVVFLPLSIMTALFIYLRDNRRFDKYVTWSLSIYTFLVIAYISLKLTLFNFTGTFGLSPETNLYTENLHIRLFTFINILWEYACLVFYPEYLFFEKPFMAFESVFTLQGVFGLSLIAAFLYVTIRIRKSKMAFLGLGWTFGALIPYTGIIPLNAMYTEHWLYVPIIGILILLAGLYERLAGTRFAIFLLIALAPISSFFVVKTFYRNMQWSNVERFYLNELEHAKPTIRVVNNLGMYYSENNDIEKAVFYLEKAKGLGNYAQPYHNLARIYKGISEKKRIEGDRDMQIRYIDLALNEYYYGLLIDQNFIYSLTEVYDIYKSYGQIDRAKKVEKLLINIQKGGVNSPQDIKDAMMQ